MFTAADTDTDTISMGFVTTRFVATCEFYHRFLGFRTVHVDASRAVLSRDDGVSIEMLRADEPDQPAALRRPTRGEGLWMRLAVDDPDAIHARLEAAGAEIIQPPEYTASGGRRFVVRDPNGILLMLACQGAVPAGLERSFPHKHHDKKHPDSNSGHGHRLHRISRH